MTTTVSGSYPAVNSDSDATINGLTVGKGGGAVSTNTAVGLNALSSATTQATTTAIGWNAGQGVTTGSASVFVGDRISTATTNAIAVTAVGSQALQSNNGNYNTGIGFGALNATTTGSSNTALGSGSLQSNTTASNNTAVGYQALYTQTTPSAANSGFGYQAGYSITTGIQNTSIGTESGRSVTTGSQNTFLGHGSGYYMTTGSKNTIVGKYDGNQGGLDIRTASNRIVISDGDGNPVISWNGADSTFLNSASGQRYVSLQYRIAFVKKSELYWDADAAGGSGAFFVVNASGGVYLTSTGTSWTSNSDERLKENLVPIENGLEKVCSLRSVIGNFIADETKKKTPFLIAQDVEAVLPEAVSKTTLKDDESGTEYLGVSYTETIPLLVAAIKELKAEVDSLKAQLNK